METQDPSLKSAAEKYIENPPSPSSSPPPLSSMPEIPPGRESIPHHMRKKTPNPWIFNMESIFNIIEESDEGLKCYKDAIDPKQCETTYSLGIKEEIYLSRLLRCGQIHCRNNSIERSTLDRSMGQ